MRSPNAFSRLFVLALALAVAGPSFARLLFTLTDLTWTQASTVFASSAFASSPCSPSADEDGSRAPCAPLESDTHQDGEDPTEHESTDGEYLLEEATGLSGMNRRRAYGEESPLLHRWTDPPAEPPSNAII